MTSSIRAAGRLLTASVDDRTLTYLLLPYGEQGRTNVGRVTASAGVVTLPPDPTQLVANMEHDRTRPAARFLSVEETAAGLTASVRVLPTSTGDDLLVEASEGVRTGISVELDGAVIRGGRLLAGELTGAGFCTAPAFPSAQLVASDFGETVTTDTTTTVEHDDGSQSTTTEHRETTYEYTDAGAPADVDDDPEPDAEPDDTEEDQTVTARLHNRPATKPGDSLAAARTTSATTTQLRASEVFRNLASAGLEPRQLLAALDQVSQADAFDVTTVPQYLGEVWSGVEYVPEFTPLVGHADLTSGKIIGWRFVPGKTPVVGDWTGGGTEVPSNEVDLEPVEATAARIAAGWNVDRIHRDFPNPEFWAAFFRLANEDYKRKVDAKVGTHLLATASSTEVEFDPDVVPTGVSEAAAKIVKGMLRLKATQKGRAQWAILGEDLYEQWLYTRADDALAYLQVALGLGQNAIEGINVVGTSAVPDGTVRVGVRAANTLHELGGASPLRVSTEDLAVGNLTEAVYGYYGIMRHDAGGVVRVVDAAP
ncbi:hypothetical protein ABRQ22_06710 [Cellulosimicrobium sp. ES-005]|uniref:Major capsid and protease fusion protein n=1 Tax=Cellulosimicrobium sp. ES-005 TaxID=3163031 RepID=A0AAU8G6W4_9MICO